MQGRGGVEGREDGRGREWPSGEGGGEWRGSVWVRRGEGEVMDAYGWNGEDGVVGVEWMLKV